MLSADRVAGALVLVKAVDVVARGPQELPAPVWVVVLALWSAAGLALLVGAARGRLWWGLVVLAGAAFAVDYPLDLRRQHLVLLMGMALAATVARTDAERLLLWRAQLSALYGFAAVAKLNESYLGGNVLAGAVFEAPLWSSVLAVPTTSVLVLSGVALIAAEGVLAVTPWVPRWRVAGTALAAAVHVGALLFVSDDPLVALRLVVFGGTAVLLHATSAGLVGVSGPRRSPATPGTPLLS